MCQTSATSTNSSTGEDGSSSNSTTTTSTSSSGLSGGAIGGITVGAIVGVAAVLIGAFVFYRRRRKRQRASGGLAGADAELSPPGRQELPSSEHEKSLRYRLTGKVLRPAIAELHGQHGVSEKEVTAVQQASEIEPNPAPTRIISELPAMDSRRE